MFKSISDFVKKNKDVIIKAAATIGGSLFSVLVVHLMSNTVADTEVTEMSIDEEL